MSRSRKKVSQSTWCCVNHNAESRYYKRQRRKYRSVINQYFRKHWDDEDLIFPSYRSYYCKWNAPSDGYCISYYPPEFTNPYHHHNTFSYTGFPFTNSNKKLLPLTSELKLYIEAFKDDFKNLQAYEKNFRK